MVSRCGLRSLEAPRPPDRLASARLAGGAEPLGKDQQWEWIDKVNREGVQGQQLYPGRGPGWTRSEVPSGVWYAQGCALAAYLLSFLQIGSARLTITKSRKIDRKGSSAEGHEDAAQRTVPTRAAVAAGGSLPLLLSGLPLVDGVDYLVDVQHPVVEHMLFPIVESEDDLLGQETLLRLLHPTDALPRYDHVSL